MKESKVLIFSAPSGSGKSTIINHLVSKYKNLEFSISATSRQPRGAECDGVEYYFLSCDEFKDRVQKGEFLEWEEVYQGSCYGTLNSELTRIWNKGNTVLFDVDVKGGINIKRLLGDKALSIFVMPPSVEELRRRLIGRGTDVLEAIERRIAKAEEELSFSNEFDTIIINDSLEKAYADAEAIVERFLNI